MKSHIILTYCNFKHETCKIDKKKKHQIEEKPYHNVNPVSFIMLLVSNENNTNTVSCLNAKYRQLLHALCTLHIGMQYLKIKKKEIPHKSKQQTTREA